MITGINNRKFILYFHKEPLKMEINTVRNADAFGPVLEKELNRIVKHDADNKVILNDTIINNYVDKSLFTIFMLMFDKPTKCECTFIHEASADTTTIVNICNMMNAMVVGEVPRNEYSVHDDKRLYCCEVEATWLLNVIAKHRRSKMKSVK